MTSGQKKLEQLIARGHKNLTAVERKRLFTPDPAERRHLEQEIERLQRDLFHNRKLLGALSDEANTANKVARPDSTRPRVFISYSRADEAWLSRLRHHLKPLERSGFLTIWDDSRIQAGHRWREEVEATLKVAKVAVLLVSADYLASDYIADRELPFLLEAAHERGMPILPIILSPCRFARTPLSEFQAVNSPGSPLTGKSEQEQEMIFANVADVIRKALGAGQSRLLSTRS